jgi:hypothetical protein
MLEQEKENEIVRLINLHRTTKYDVQSMIVLCKELIDPRMNICTHCGAQIKFAQNQLTNWYNLYKEQMSNTPQLEGDLDIQTEKVVVQPEPKPKCSSCKKKTYNKK